MRIKYLLALLLLGFGALNASGAQNEAPYKLALVVQAGAHMNQPWQLHSRGQALLKALNMQLASLPLAVDLRLWWVNEAVQVFDRRTWPRLNPGASPGFGGQPPMLPALRQAIDWLRPEGSLLLIACDAGGDWPIINAALNEDNLFCHTLALDARNPQILQAIAQAGGGGYFAASSPGQVINASNAAIKTAISPARMLIAAHDQNNQKLDIELELKRDDIFEKSRSAASWSPFQLMPGSYRIGWPQNSPLPGPGELPARLTVAKSGQQELAVGGSGLLSVKCLDENGQELRWPLAVLNADSGHLWEAARQSPFSLALPAGNYRVYTTGPSRQEWRLRLGAGQNLEQLLGPKASLLLTVPGPGKNWTLPFSLRSGSQPPQFGQSGVKMPLNPGKYILSLETIPPYMMALELRPGQHLPIEIPAQGALRVSRSSGKPKSFAILDQQGQRLGRGGENRALLLQPGRYWLAWEGNPQRLEVVILPGQFQAAQEPAPPAP